MQKIIIFLCRIRKNAYLCTHNNQAVVLLLYSSSAKVPAREPSPSLLIVKGATHSKGADITQFA